MRILVAGLSRFTTPSGVCRFAANLCLSIESKAEVVLACGSWQAKYFEETLGLGATNVRVNPVDIPNSAIARNKWYGAELDRLALSIQASLIHLSFPMPRSRGSKIPVVGTVHDMYPFDIPQNFGFPKYLLNQFAFRRFVKAIDGATCVSGETLNRLRHYFPKEDERLKPVVIYNCVRPAETSEKPPIFGANEPFLLSVGQHRPNKNLESVIRSFGKLRESKLISPSTRLLIVGSDGPSTGSLRQLADSLPKNSIEFTHGLPDGQLRWLYENALVLIAPSLQEGFCLPPIEAALYGCPLVVSDLPIFREVAPPSATFVEPSNIEALTKAILAKIKSARPQPLRMANYEFETAGEAYIALYRHLID